MELLAWISTLLGVAAILLTVIEFQVFKSLPKYKLAIGILSSRENFVQRDAIRSTWLSALDDNRLSASVFYSFVLATEDCGVPVEYRISKYSCQEQERWAEDDDLESLHFWKAGQVCDVAGYPPEYRTVGVDFEIIHDVVVSGFALPVGSAGGSLVQLWDLASYVLVAEAKVSKETRTEFCWHVKDIHPHVLPKGFIGSLVVSCDGVPCIGVKRWRDSYGYSPAVSFSPTVRFMTQTGEHVLPVAQSGLVLPALMLLKLADVLSVKRHIHNRDSAYLQRKHHLKEVNAKLKEEMSSHGDVVMLPDVNGNDLEEVYRNLPRKLVSFHHWCSSNINAEYVMKTDDDSYVDVEKVVQALVPLEDHRMTLEWLWLGHFRRLWNVDRWGKWVEHKYSAPVYPDHACGAGNVLSATLSSWLSENRNNLYYYQGEDVSVGIWFASLRVQYIHDPHWLCDNKCESDMVVSAQHSPRDLRRLWGNRVQCGDPCSCF